jgi:hypothetical protein
MYREWEIPSIENTAIFSETTIELTILMERIRMGHSRGFTLTTYFHRCFQIVFFYVAQVSHEFGNLSHQLPKYSDHRHGLLTQLAFAMF